MQEAYRRLKLPVQNPSLRAWNPLIEGTILQPLDHFNRQNPLTLNQVREARRMEGRPSLAVLTGRL